MKRGVIFDLDGLLADTEPVWAESARRLLARRGLTWDPSLKPRFMGRHPLEVAGMLVEHYGLQERPEALLEERLALVRGLYERRQLQAMPGARELVSLLATQGLPMAVASGSLTDIAASVVAHIGLAGAFSHVLGSDQVARGKPRPDLFLLAARLLGRPPERCIVLEDAAAGVEAALAAGMTCYCVPSPETPPEAAARAHRVLGSLADLGLADFQ